MLKKHNHEAFLKVLEYFKKSKRVCIVHPTGTGKSYVAKAVAEYFGGRILYLAPSECILEQQKRKGIFSNCKNVTYLTMPKLMALYRNKEYVSPTYDFMVIDEIHRLGATKWGSAYKKLLADNPDARVFGMTATEKRYLDGERDMAAELFGQENVASYYTMADAWDNGIYLPPIYVMGTTLLDGCMGDIKKMLSKNIDRTKINDYLGRLRSSKIEWRESFDVSHLLKKYIQKDTKHIIVFNNTIRTAREIRQSFEKWFKEAGFKNVKFYNADSKDRNALKHIEEFNQDDYEGVKVMLSVNMLNEGIHVDCCDAVILLRSTESKNIFFQQIGRCMSVNNIKNPVILDLVDNLHRDNYMVEFSRKSNHCGGHREQKEGHGVLIIDTLLGFRQLYEDISLAFNSHLFEENLILLEEFVKKNNRLPNSKNEGENSLYPFYYNHKDDERVKSIVNKYEVTIRSIKSFEENLILFEEFVKENNRLPRYNVKEEKTLYTFYNKHKNDESVKNILKKYGLLVTPIRNDADGLKALEEFFKRYRRLPVKIIPEEKELYEFYEKNKMKQVITTLKHRYDITPYFDKFFENGLSLMKKYLETPELVSSVEMRDLRMFYRKYRKDSLFIEIMRKYNGGTDPKINL